MPKYVRELNPVRRKADFDSLWNVSASKNFFVSKRLPIVFSGVFLRLEVLICPIFHLGRVEYCPQQRVVHRSEFCHLPEG